MDQPIISASDSSDIHIEGFVSYGTHGSFAALNNVANFSAKSVSLNVPFEFAPLVEFTRNISKLSIDDSEKKELYTEALLTLSKDDKARSKEVNGFASKLNDKYGPIAKQFFMEFSANFSAELARKALLG